MVEEITYFLRGELGVNPVAYGAIKDEPFVFWINAAGAGGIALPAPFYCLIDKMIAAAHEPRVKLSALLGGHFDFAAACFHLLQRGERIKVFGYVCVKDIAVMFGHVQSGVPQKSLQGKRIPATINKIFSGECVAEQVNACFRNPAPRVIVHDAASERIFR